MIEIIQIERARDQGYATIQEAGGLIDSRESDAAPIDAFANRFLIVRTTFLIGSNFVWITLRYQSPIVFLL